MAIHHKIKAKIQTSHEKYKRYYPATFFIGGFLFDIVTLSRIDDWLNLLQQTAYLIFIIQLLKYRTYEAAGVWNPGPKLHRIWHYNDEALHFVLGSLLSTYTLFYFVSSSFSTSFLFLILMFTLLVGNEFPSLQNKGLILKYSLLSICIFSFLFIVVPITFGFIGLLPFVVSILLGLLLHGALFLEFKKKNLPQIDIRKTVLGPPVAIATLLLFLYVIKFLPPIPLSIQYIGIYHQIEKIHSEKSGEMQFLLKYERPFWKFWQHGAQDFLAEPGDKIHCFVRIFAPTHFKDKIVFHWMRKTANGWESMDKITNEISGGRTEGYRGFAIKSNFEPGDWRVEVETTDERKIGRIGFTVSMTNEKNLVRELKTDTY
jgi:hypothetical protein